MLGRVDPSRVRAIVSSHERTVAAAIEIGFNDKFYFVAVKLPRLDNEQANGSYPVRQRWMTAPPELAAPLLELARDRLRPAPAPPHMPGSTDASRVPYERVWSREMVRLGHSVASLIVSGRKGSPTADPLADPSSEPSNKPEQG